ncbi:MAG: T9SS type A sorting domain-containing protein, partial [Bacteroidales bacterium]|nr:T9SS type A sorting domain-containing protein [Bacteroidales bacterium]
NGLFTGYVYTNMSLRGSVKYVDAVGAVSVSRTPVTVTLLYDMVWNGSAGTDWNTGANWNSGMVPTEVINVTIPDVTNDPVINWFGGVCNDLTIESGASLLVDAGSFVTYGTVTNNGSFSINVPQATDLWELIGVPVSGATADIFLGNYLQSYTEATDTWNEIIEPETPLVPGEGYALWVQSKVGLFTYSGTPNTGNYSTDYTYTPTGNPLHYGFNLMGNPYPSYIDWDVLNETYGAVYQYDGYAYSSWNGTGTGSSFIDPGKGFLIAPASSGSLLLTNACRATQLPVKSANATDNTVVIQAGNENYMDELYVVFNPEATDQFDLQYDAWKILTDEDNIAQVFSIMGEKNLSIDQQPMTTQLPVGFTCGESGSYYFTLGDMTWEGPVYLEDTKTGAIHDMHTGDYVFGYEVGEAGNRFILHFTTLGIDKPEELSNVNVWSTGNRVVVSSSEIFDNTGILIFDITGKKVFETNISQTNRFEMSPGLNTGLYFVKVLTGNVITTRKVYIK